MATSTTGQLGFYTLSISPTAYRAQVGRVGRAEAAGAQVGEHAARATRAVPTSGVETWGRQRAQWVAFCGN
jgi:hypothetical protein